MSVKQVIAVLNILVLRGAGSGVTVLFVLLVARHLDTNSAGHFFLLFNICAIAAICFRWGFDEVIIRRMASVSGKDIEILAHQLLRYSHLRVMKWFIFSVVLVGVFLYSSLSSVLYGFQAAELFVGVAASSLIALTACAARVQQGIGNTNYAAFFLSIFVPLLSLVGLLVLIATGTTIDVFDLIFLYGGAAMTGYVGVVSTRYGSPVAILQRCPFASVAGDLEMDRLAANKLGGVVIAQQALNWGTMIIVPMAYGAAVYKGFVVTQKLALLIGLVMLSVNFTFSSRFATLHASGQLAELRRLIGRSVAGIVGGSVLASAAVILFRSTVFDFARIDLRMDGVLVVMLLSQVFFALASLYSVVLSMCRDETFLLSVQAVSNIAGLLLFSILSQFYEIEVACSVLVVTYFIMMLVLRLRIKYIIFDSNKNK